MGLAHTKGVKCRWLDFAIVMGTRATWWERRVNQRMDTVTSAVGVYSCSTRTAYARETDWAQRPRHYVVSDAKSMQGKSVWLKASGALTLQAGVCVSVNSRTWQHPITLRLYFHFMRHASIRPLDYQSISLNWLIGAINSFNKFFFSPGLRNPLVR